MTFSDHAVKLQQFQRYINLKQGTIHYGALLFKDPVLWARSVPARIRDALFGGSEAPAYVVADVRKHAMKMLDSAADESRQLEEIRTKIQRAQDELKHMQDLRSTYESAKPAEGTEYIKAFIDQLNALSVEFGSMAPPLNDGV